MSFIQSITLAEGLVSLGLALDIIGVYALSVSGILGKKPARTWWYLWRHVDSENPGETENDPPVRQFSPVGGGMAAPIPPNDSDSYDWAIWAAGKQTLGVWTIILGFLLQIVGTLI